MFILYISICYLSIVNLGFIGTLLIWCGAFPLTLLGSLMSSKKTFEMKYLPTTHGTYTYTITSYNDRQRLTIYQVNLFTYSYMNSISKSTWTTKDLISTLESTAKEYDDIYKEKHKKELELKYLNEEMTTWGKNK